MIRKRAAVFDLDGTITRADTYVDFLLAVLRHYPSRLLRAAWLPLAVALHFTGLRDNTWLKRVFLGSIAAGLKRDQVDALARRFVGRVLERSVRPGALAALEWHRARGDRIVLATASFDFYVRELAARLGIGEVLCTQSDWDQNQLAATLRGGNCYAQEKLRRVVTLFGQERQTWHVIVYSDHHSDRDILDWADEGVAVNPDPRLRAHCLGKGLVIVNWDSGN